MTTPPSKSQSRSAVVIALGLAALGVAAIASGAALLLSAPADDPVPTAAPTTTATAPTTAAVTTTTTVPLGGGFDAAKFTPLVDDSGALSLSVPATWIDFDTGPWVRDGAEIGPSVSAATDQTAWVEGWGTPGIFVGATDQMGFDEAFGDFSAACVFDRTSSIEADGLIGTGEWWADCGFEGSDFFVGVVTLEDGSSIVLFQIVAVDGAIGELVDRILGTFRYQESR